MTVKSLQELPNIGKTVAARLVEIGIENKSQLQSVGAARAYQRLSESYPDKHLPVCYYLYSLEAALQGKHWNDLSDQDKANLRLAAGLPK